MDAVDLQILRELTQAQGLAAARPGLSPSYRRIARSLAVAPGTVRHRVLRMVRDGVLTGTSVYPNPNVLGRRVWTYAFDVAPARDKRAVVDALLALPGVFLLQNFRGPLVGLVVAVPRDRPVEPVLRRVDGIAGSARGWVAEAVYPPCALPLTEADRALLARLGRGPFASHAALAAELDTSVRTLKRRLRRLLRAFALVSVPTMDYAAVSGRVPADLIVRYSDPVARPEADRQLHALTAPYLIYAGPWSTFTLFSMLLPKVVTARELLDRARSVPGVANARLEFVEEHIDRHHALVRFLGPRRPPPKGARPAPGRRPVHPRAGRSPAVRPRRPRQPP